MLMLQPAVCCDCEIILVVGGQLKRGAEFPLYRWNISENTVQRGLFEHGLYNYSFAVCECVCVFSYFSSSEAIITAHRHGSLLLSAGLISHRMNRNCQSDAALSSETRGDWLLLPHTRPHTPTYTPPHAHTQYTHSTHRLSSSFSLVFTLSLPSLVQNQTPPKPYFLSTFPYFNILTMLKNQNSTCLYDTRKGEKCILLGFCKLMWLTIVSLSLVVDQYNMTKRK